ncbi:protein disulfide-isomerase domain protein [Dictyocaulus viviparus]|uniref:Protein disulfide-isomerase domain protein n=1 Tax=Dictyocaulus viviparus TaxID=29172 RepID=A0A0D8XFN0_DICVI|nr:protein disulfide-isomerase domain protein [Dictyocaulus viviparus]
MTRSSRSMIYHKIAIIVLIFDWIYHRMCAMRCLLLLLLLLSRYFLLGEPLTVVIDLNEKFLDFYAPWCAHCKRLLPIWEHLGHAVSDKNLPVRVAKMDCTRFTNACNKLSISGYPTIVFFRQGQKIEYFGERTKEALLNFVIKSAAPIVESIDAVRLNDIRRDYRNDPAFIILGDDDDDMRTEFQTIASSLFSKNRFFSMANSSVPEQLRELRARVTVFKDSSFFPFHGSVEKLKSWIMAERWPLMPRASHSNLADLATTGKLTVLVICTEVLHLILYKKPISSVMYYLYENFVTVKYILVFNYTTYEYYLNDDEPDKVTRASLVSWLSNLADGIDSGVVVPLGGRSLPVRIRRMIFELYSNVTQMFATQPLLSSVLFGMPIAFLSIICYSICSADFTVDREEFYPDDEEYDEEIDIDEHSRLVDSSHVKNE